MCISAEATEQNNVNTRSSASEGAAEDSAPAMATYRARIQLDAQTLIDPQGNKLTLTPGMQTVA